MCAVAGAPPTLASNSAELRAALRNARQSIKLCWTPVDRACVPNTGSVARQGVYFAPAVYVLAAARTYGVSGTALLFGTLSRAWVCGEGHFLQASGVSEFVLQVGGGTITLEAQHWSTPVLLQQRAAVVRSGAPTCNLSPLPSACGVPCSAARWTAFVRTYVPCSSSSS